MPTAAVNGIEIEYEVGGEGPGVLLSHGYSATGRMWTSQRPALETRYRLVTWDMRGHGRTSSPGDAAEYSAAKTVQDMAALLDLLDMPAAVVGGLSLGGYMSLEFFIAHPQRVRALVLCDTGPGYRNAEARAGWNRMAESRATQLEERGEAAIGRGSAETRTAVHSSAKGLALAARGMLAQFDSRVIDALPAVNVPTIVIVGSEDTNFIAGSEYMAKKIPGARLEVIEGAGHASNIDKTDDFNRILLEFLDALPK